MQPSLFVSHGAPTLILDPAPARDFLAGLGDRWSRDHGRPAAILCLSAHWETAAPAAQTTERPETIHDFYGFPEALYRLNYAAPGAPDAARCAIELLRDAGFDASEDSGRGLDHGAWCPLKLMFPAADVAIAQLSIQPHLGARHHYDLGRALAPLRRQDILVMASGGATHNVPEAMARGPAAGETPDWAAAFDTWLCDRIAAGAVDDLVDYRARAPGAQQSHPRDEHLIPLYAALGAADGAPGRRLHASFTYGSLSMATFAFG